MKLPAQIAVIKTIEEGKIYDLVVTPKDLTTPGLGILLLETDCPIKKHQVQQVFAMIRRPTPSHS